MSRSILQSVSRPAVVVLAMLVAVAIASSMPACGDNSAQPEQPDGQMDGMPDGEPPCDAPAPWTYETLRGALHAADCAAMLRCDPLVQFQSVEECVANFDRKSDGARTKYLRGLKEALDHRTAALDQVGVTRCLAELNSGTCPASLASPACKAMLVGMRAAGAACFSNEECASGSCAGLDAEQACGAGTCSGQAAIGQACSAQTACVAGAHCVGNGAGSVCESGDAGARCALHADCDDELWCNGGTCTADLAAGASCRDDAACGGGTVCVGDLFGAGVGVCGKVTAVGDVCDDYCFGAVYCRRRPAANGSCQALPKEGEACNLAFGRCAGVDLYCDESDKCMRLPDLGEPCTAFCKVGLFCTTEVTGEIEGTCSALAATGAPCARDGNCASYHCDDNNKCAEWSACRGVAPDPPPPPAASCPP
jgi:hypothetical protein